MKRVEELEVRINRNSSNSSKPPSSDSPFPKRSEKKSGGKPGAKKGHQECRQQMPEAKTIHPLQPQVCSCGSHDFRETNPFYTHPYIKLPETCLPRRMLVRRRQVQLDVTHFVLHSDHCPWRGKRNKASLPPQYCTGYGPRFCAAMAQMAGGQADS